MNDNGVCVPSATCGTGTVADPSTGACVPDGSVVCTDGTKFDPGTGTCVIDPDSCQGGTVLIGNQCVDPTAGLTVDLEEGAEPNGVGIIEASNAPAGTITLKPVGGDSYVIHGHITPFQDTDGDGQMDPDVDSYVLQVSGPTLIHMTSDGVHGIDAGFVAVANVGQNDPLASWIRFGLNITGDTSKRQVFLPAAGTYIIAIADTHTLYQYATGGPTNAAPGDADGEYYVSIDQLAIPAPTAITATNGVATQAGSLSSDEVQFYSVGMGMGLNDATLETTAPQITASLVASVNDNFRAIGDASAGLFGPVPASVAFGGVNAGDTTVFAVDDEYDTATMPVDFTLTVNTRDAAALSTTGGDATQTETVNTGDAPLAVNQFYYDVTAADQVLGMNLHWNVPVDGLVVDQNLYIFASFTYDPSNGFVGDTFQDFNGLLRHAAPGRYYFLVYDPAGTAGTDSLTATSTISEVTPSAVTLGTATADQTVSSFGQDAFTFDSTASDWDVFDATGTGTGNVNVAFYDPTSAYGRLGSLDYTSHYGYTDTYGPEAPAAFTKSIDPAGAPQGQILLSQPTHNFFGTVTTDNATGSYVLDFTQRMYHDFGTVAAGNDATVMGETIDGTTSENYYLITSGMGNELDLTATPSALLDPYISFLADDESATDTVDNGLFGAAETGTATFNGSPAYVAFKVGGTLNAAASGTYDLTATVPLPPYSVTTTSTAFSDACTGGTMVSISDTDEEVAGPIDAPTGFTFFGTPVSQFVVSTNGWLSFDTTLTSAAYSNQSLPNSSDPNAVIAPYWDDLDQVSVCTKMVGNKLVVQWTGYLYSFAAETTTVQFQAILDPSDSSIEYVYGAGQQADGSSATVGVENAAGDQAFQVSYDTASVAPSTSMKLTPN